VRAGRSAAVGVVTEGVDVEATLGVGVVAGDVPGDGGGRALGLLLEHNGAGDLGVSTEDSDCTEDQNVSHVPSIQESQGPCGVDSGLIGLSPWSPSS
jgi:hypothetical protein